MENLKISHAIQEDLTKLRGFAEALRHEEDVDYFPRQFEHQAARRRVIILAQDEEAIAGYCILNWEPKYAFFKKMGFPEIQDLIVHPQFRRRGLATRMIDHCEAAARGRGMDYMGIGVGLHHRFGAAQRLYARLGYIPDGNGITYDRQPVTAGEFRPVDDDLCLMMVKDLALKV
ncbi:MAG: GNAT family N-acetyltransferase [Alphaproteobacteria bacterium]|nr:GNAT family N-acetyltransferase [Alphaproteobacteria bacterium]